MKRLTCFARLEDSEKALKGGGDVSKMIKSMDSSRESSLVAVRTFERLVPVMRALMDC